MTDITILTDPRYVDPKNPDEYALNVLLEDRLLADSLTKKGLAVDRAAWSDPQFDWSNTRFALFRTTWDYFDHFAQFQSWLDQITAKTTLINTIDLVRWNMDKHYLLELNDNGVNIAPTKIFEQGSQVGLGKAVEELGWSEMVLKPCVAGGGRHTYKFSPDQTDDIETIFHQLVREEAMMLQEFQHNVPRQGELSLMIVGKECTHAVLKKSKEGDFRVQDDFGGTVHPHEVSIEEIDFAHKVIELCSPEPIYGRVDLFRDNHNELALAELELIEPEMWFRLNPKAADQMASFIHTHHF